jgi:hypothetical protein
MAQGTMYFENNHNGDARTAALLWLQESSMTITQFEIKYRDNTARYQFDGFSARTGSPVCVYFSDAEIITCGIKGK